RSTARYSMKSGTEIAGWNRGSGRRDSSSWEAPCRERAAATRERSYRARPESRRLLLKQVAHLVHQRENSLLFLRDAFQDVLRLGVVGLLRLDEAEAGQREVVAVCDDFRGGHAPRRPIGCLALGPFLL